MQIVVKYSDFGAIGDGVANDFAAIKAAHNYANERRLPVEGQPGRTYRLGDNGTDSSIPGDTTGMGLDNMQARVAALKGTIRFSTQNGFHIFVSIPKEPN